MQKGANFCRLVASFLHGLLLKLSPVKYFNARLLHYSGRFATNPEYLFFAQFIIEQKKISDSINIALTKVHGQPITASHLRSNTQSLQNFICQDQAYRIYSLIRRTIFAEKICLFDQNLLKTRGASYNRVFSSNKI